MSLREGEKSLGRDKHTQLTKTIKDGMKTDQKIFLCYMDQTGDVKRLTANNSGKLLTEINSNGREEELEWWCDGRSQTSLALACSRRRKGKRENTQIP